MTIKTVWHIVKESARHVGVARLAPHDLRRTCARLCHASGGEFESVASLADEINNGPVLFALLAFSIRRQGGSRWCLRPTRLAMEFEWRFS